MNVVDSRTVGRLVERNPLGVALVLSLVIHVSVYSGWQLGKHLGWWKYHPAWLTSFTRWLAKPNVAKARPNKPPESQVIPLTFVEINPDTATAEAPENAKYYSSKNSKAANPDPREQQAVKVDGKQDQIVRLMDNDKPKPFPLQPSPPKPPVEKPEPKTDTPGDLALVRPKDGQADTSNAEPPKDRPRTLAAARQKAMLSGQTMKQAGGVSDRGQVSFDVKATAFGDYDAAFIAAVEQCWHILIDEHQGTRRAGRVVVDFRLTYDGRITDIKVQENEVGEILSMLCQSAIVNPQPYPRWPAPMRQTIGGNSREIRFTFIYY